jgi:hypothetical protein
MDTLKDIIVTRTMVYSPEFYLECCEQNGETPSQEDFLDFIREDIHEDFVRDNASQDISYGE